MCNTGVECRRISKGANFAQCTPVSRLNEIPFGTEMAQQVSGSAALHMYVELRRILEGAVSLC